jgi:DNA-directed RNA polymerase subunit RPC12/RpoP
MSDLEKQTTELPCPKCNRAIEVSFYEMMSRREAKCRRCSSKYKFKSSPASRLRSKIRDLERAQEKFQEAVQEVVESADMEVKN